MMRRDEKSGGTYAGRRCRVSSVVGQGLERTWQLTDDSQAAPSFAVRLLQRRHLSVGVALLMGTLPLPRLVERPVFVEIATAAKRP